MLSELEPCKQEFALHIPQVTKYLQFTQISLK